MRYRISLLFALAVLAPARGRAQADVALPGAGAASGVLADADTIPPPMPREMRGVWVATVGNMDWPSRRGLTTSEQQAELRAILDRAAGLHLNAIFLQVRPAGDALYRSSLEPWSEVLTGRMGQAPSPTYDPLAFAIQEAHRRGLELHAWFNPYRAKTPGMRSPVARNHVTRMHPSWVRKYGSHLWMDPGEPAVRRHAIAVVLDVLRRYDIDGVHLDDYFYPYRENHPRTHRPIEFPDGATYRRYRRGGGRLDRDDWRRENVNMLVRELNAAVHREKPWVRFGVSPFGIWRPGNPRGVDGLDAYREIFADARKWVRNGWLDYVVPQLYWPLDRPAQPYIPLMAWWAEQNVHHRHLWIGNYTGRVRAGDRNDWPAGEVLRQVELTRGPYGASGNVHFSMEVLMADRDRVGTRLLEGPYAQLALVPATPWLDDDPPRAPRLWISSTGPQLLLRIDPGGAEPARFWVVRTREPRGWSATIVAGTDRTVVLAERSQRVPPVVVVSAVDRAGNEGARRVMLLRQEAMPR